MKHLIIFSLLISFFTVNAQQFNGPYIDMDYHPSVKTTQIYPKYGAVTDAIKTPVIPLNNNTSLTLEFDILGLTQYRLAAEIIHLDNQWWKSNRVENEYLYDFNEFQLTDIEASFNTKVDFVHYRLKIPKVKISGNYLVVIYNEDNPQEVFLTRRYMVFEDLLTITKDQTAFSGAYNDPYQYVNFNINYESINNINPTEDFKIVIRKNGSYQQEIKNIKPTFIDAVQKNITFNFTDSKSLFIAGNQFRTFDLRSSQTAGINVGSIDDSKDINIATLLTDEPRINKTLLSTHDINGNFYIDHYEYGDGDLNSDYIYTYFILRAQKAPVGDIYVHGALTNWKLNKEFKMKYDAENEFYYCRPLIKQGYYNYEYILAANSKNIDYAAIEGSYNLTENNYEIFVYIKKPGTQNERLVGYKSLILNPTR